MEPVGYKLRFQKKMRQIFDMDNARSLGSPSSSLRVPSNPVAAATPPVATDASQKTISSTTRAGVVAQSSLTRPAQSDENRDAEDSEGVYEPEI